MDLLKYLRERIQIDRGTSHEGSIYIARGDMHVEFRIEPEEIRKCVLDRCSRPAMDELIERYFRPALVNLLCASFPDAYNEGLENMKKKFGA